MDGTVESNGNLRQVNKAHRVLKTFEYITQLLLLPHLVSDPLPIPNPSAS
jgi:hypothetical protein